MFVDIEVLHGLLESETHLRTSIFPNVRDIKRTCISSAFDEKANSSARISSIP
jgi:hypothetical protein